MIYINHDKSPHLNPIRRQARRIAARVARDYIDAFEGVRIDLGAAEVFDPRGSSPVIGFWIVATHPRHDDSPRAFVAFPHQHVARGLVKLAGGLIHQ